MTSIQSCHVTETLSRYDLPYFSKWIPLQKALFDRPISVLKRERTSQTCVIIRMTYAVSIAFILIFFIHTVNCNIPFPFNNKPMPALAFTAVAHALLSAVLYIHQRTILWNCRSKDNSKKDNKQVCDNK